MPSINWSHAAVGVLFDHSPPNTRFVFNIVNNHWEVHEPIHIYRIGPYFIFACQYIRDHDAILSFNTTFIDGKPITFRPSSAHQIPSSINFNMARIWVRIQDLPWEFFNSDRR